MKAKATTSLLARALSTLGRKDCPHTPETPDPGTANTANTSNDTAKTFREQFVIRIFAALLAILAVPYATAADARAVYQFNLPEQSLSEALKAIGQQTTTNILFDPGSVLNKTAPALRATLTAKQAIEHVLQGTDLTAKQSATDTVLVQPQKVASVPLSTLGERGRGEAFPPLPLGEGPGEGINTEGEGKGKGFWSRFRLAQADTSSRSEEENKTPSSRDNEKKVMELEEITVTGTHVRGGIQANSVTQISREDIERGGFLDIGQAIRSLPGNFGGGLNVESFAAGGAVLDNANRTIPGTSSANLHGLGSGATLVLLDGNRLPTIGYGLSVDLSMIPSAAIERIDVLRDGASAIYGADAVAGVINIVTRKEYDGAETRFRYGEAQGGLGTFTASGLAGHSWERVSAVVAYEHFDQSPLGADKRSRSSTVDQPTTLFGESIRDSAYLSGKLDLSDNVRVIADGQYTQRTLEDNVFTRTSLRQQFDNSTEVSQFALHGGLQADVFGDWILDISGNLGENVTKDRTVTTSTVTGANLNATQPRYKNGLWSTTAELDGSLTVLPAGPVRAALGASYRHEYSDQFTTTGRNNPSRDVTSVYAELNVPVIRSFGVIAAGRYDDYSDFGGVSNPKVGFAWKPIASTTITGTYSESFRAPSAFDLSRSYFAIVTDARSDAAAGMSRILYVNGTGRPVGPENSVNKNIGISIEPDGLPGFHASIDYYRVNYDNRIALPDPNAALAFDIRNAPSNFLELGPDLASVNGLIAGAFSIIPLGVAVPIDPTLIVAIVDARSTNIAKTLLDGFEGSLWYRHRLGTGDFVMSADLNYINHFREQLSSTAAPVDRVGTIFSPPDFRSRVGTQWSNSDWSLSAYWNHTDSYVDNRTAVARKVGAWNTFDASISYDFGAGQPRLADGLRLILSATNLFDQDPPLIRGGTAPRQAFRWDGTNASIVGRFIGLEIVKRW